MQRKNDGILNRECLMCANHKVSVKFSLGHYGNCPYRRCICNYCAETRRKRRQFAVDKVPKPWCPMCYNHNLCTTMSKEHRSSCNYLACLCSPCCDSVNTLPAHLKLARENIFFRRVKRNQRTSEASSSSTSDSIAGGSSHRNPSPPPPSTDERKLCLYCLNHGTKVRLQDHSVRHCKYRYCTCLRCEVSTARIRGMRNRKTQFMERRGLAEPGSEKGSKFSVSPKKTQGAPFPKTRQDSHPETQPNLAAQSEPPSAKGSENPEEGREDNEIQVLDVSAKIYDVIDISSDSVESQQMAPNKGLKSLTPTVTAADSRGGKQSFSESAQDKASSVQVVDSEQGSRDPPQRKDATRGGTSRSQKDADSVQATLEFSENSSQKKGENSGSDVQEDYRSTKTSMIIKSSGASEAIAASTNPANSGQFVPFAFSSPISSQVNGKKSDKKQSKKKLSKVLSKALPPGPDPVVNNSKEETPLKAKRSTKACALCKNHGVQVQKKGHKACPYSACECLKCSRTLKFRLASKEFFAEYYHTKICKGKGRRRTSSLHSKSSLDSTVDGSEDSLKSVSPEDGLRCRLGSSSGDNLEKRLDSEQISAPSSARDAGSETAPSLHKSKSKKSKHKSIKKKRKSRSKDMSGTLFRAEQKSETTVASKSSPLIRKSAEDVSKQACGFESQSGSADMKDEKETDTFMSIKYCLLCRNHGLKVNITGHKKLQCEFFACDCNDCSKVAVRRKRDRLNKRKRYSPSSDQPISESISIPTLKEAKALQRSSVVNVGEDKAGAVGAVEDDASHDGRRTGDVQILEDGSSGHGPCVRDDSFKCGWRVVEVSVDESLSLGEVSMAFGDVTGSSSDSVGASKEVNADIAETPVSSEESPPTSGRFSQGSDVAGEEHRPGAEKTPNRNLPTVKRSTTKPREVKPAERTIPSLKCNVRLNDAIISIINTKSSAHGSAVDENKDKREGTTQPPNHSPALTLNNGSDEGEAVKQAWYHAQPGGDVNEKHRSCQGDSGIFFEVKVKDILLADSVLSSRVELGSRCVKLDCPEENNYVGKECQKLPCTEVSRESAPKEITHNSVPNATESSQISQEARITDTVSMNVPVSLSGSVEASLAELFGSPEASSSARTLAQATGASQSETEPAKISTLSTVAVSIGKEASDETSTEPLTAKERPLGGSSLLSNRSEPVKCEIALIARSAASNCANEGDVSEAISSEPTLVEALHPSSARSVAVVQDSGASRATDTLRANVPPCNPESVEASLSKLFECIEAMPASTTEYELTAASQTVIKPVKDSSSGSQSNTAIPVEREGSGDTSQQPLLTIIRPLGSTVSNLLSHRSETRLCESALVARSTASCGTRDESDLSEALSTQALRPETARSLPQGTMMMKPVVFGASHTGAVDSLALRARTAGGEPYSNKMFKAIQGESSEASDLPAVPVELAAKQANLSWTAGRPPILLHPFPHRERPTVSPIDTERKQVFTPINSAALHTLAQSAEPSQATALIPAWDSLLAPHETRVLSGKDEILTGPPDEGGNAALDLRVIADTQVTRPRLQADEDSLTTSLLQEQVTAVSAEEEVAQDLTCHSRTVLKPRYGRKLHPCTECKLKFATRKKLARHRIKEHTLPQPEACRVCHVVSRSPFAHEVHRNSAHTTCPAVCQLCLSNFPTSLLRDVHLYDMHDKRELVFTCPSDSCGFFADSPSALSHHVDTVHHGARPFACTFCGARVHSVQLLVRHHNEHVEALSRDGCCEFCCAWFPSTELLRAHLSDCHDDRHPYSCPQCKQRFECLESQTSHVSSVHPDEAPFKCDSCELGHDTLPHLQAHLQCFTHLPFASAGRTLCPPCDVVTHGGLAMQDHVDEEHLGFLPLERAAQLFTLMKDAFSLG